MLSILNRAIRTATRVDARFGCSQRPDIQAWQNRFVPRRELQHPDDTERFGPIRGFW